MRRQTKHLADEYSSRLQQLEYTRRNVEALFAKNALPRRDVDRVYESLFLNAVTSFELLIEELFLGLLMQRLRSNTPDQVARVDIQPRKLVRDIVFGREDYLTWLPYGATEERAKIFFAEGKPFTLLEDEDKSMLKQCLIIRNAIAHQSEFAESQFLKKVNGVGALAPKEQMPCRYLRSVFRAAPRQLHYENLIARLRLIAYKLCI